MKNLKLGLALAALGLVCPGLASAAVIPTNLDVRATVVAACDSLSTTPVDFGAYNNAVTNAEGSISLRCNEGTPYKIGLSGGTNFDIPSQRNRMTSSTAGGVISYRLYKDAARSSVWGACTTAPFCSGATALAGTSTGAIETLTVFGQALTPDLFNPAPQPGAFSDTVLVELHF